MATATNGIGTWAEIKANKSGYYSPTFTDSTKCPNNYTLREQNYKTGIASNTSLKLPLYANVIKNQPFAINFVIDHYIGSYSSMSFNNLQIALRNGNSTGVQLQRATIINTVSGSSTTNWLTYGTLYFGELFTINTSTSTQITIEIGGYVTSVGQYYYTIYNSSGTIIKSKTALTQTTSYTGTLASLNNCVVVISTSQRTIASNSYWYTSWKTHEPSYKYKNIEIMQYGVQNVEVSFASSGGGTSTASLTEADLTLGSWDDI